MTYRTVNGFVKGIPNYQMFGTLLAELRRGFVAKHRNFRKFLELKKVLYESYETIFVSQNLKSFRGSMLNLKSLVQYLFFVVYVMRNRLQLEWLGPIY